MAAAIYNNESNTIITGTSGNDTIRNGGYWDGLNHNSGTNVTINAGVGNDYIYNLWGEKVTVNAGLGNDTICNDSGDKMLLNSGAGNDSIENLGGDLVTIDCGEGDDYVWISSGDSLSINLGSGNDFIANCGAKATISGSTGNDTICNGCYAYNDGDVVYYEDYEGLKVVFEYRAGDGNDVIYGFKEDSTLRIIDSPYNTMTSGNDIIVAVDNGIIRLVDAASLSAVNIKSGGSTTLTVNDKMKSPVTIGSSIKTVNASTRTKAVQITGNDSANSISGGSANDTIYGGKGNDTILGNKGNDKLFGDAGNDYLSGGNGADTLSGGAGNDTLIGGKGADLFVYSAGNDVITDYADEDKISIAGTAKVKTSGSDVIFTVGKGKLTVKGGKDKTVTYLDADGEHVYPEPNSDVIINGKVITLTEDYLEDSFNVADYGKALQTIDASAVQLDLSITGNKLRNSIKGGENNETLIGGKGNDTLTGGAGSDVFVYAKGDGNDIITDYTSDDRIKIAKGTATVEKKGKDIIFTVGSGKITVKGAADKVVTYLDAKGKTNYYPKPTKDSIIINGTSVTVLEEYKSATFDVGNIKDGNKIKKIDASAVTHDLAITGNGKANVILGGEENDTITGGKGNDTLQGGTGADTFLYANGDGNDIILDYEEDDTIKITKGTAKVATKGSDVVFTVGSGKMTLLNAADKTITYIAGGKTKTYGSTASFIEDDNNYELTPNLSSIVQKKSIDYSLLSTATKLSKETNLIAYAKK